MDVRFVSRDKNVLNKIIRLINCRLKLNPHRMLNDPYYKMIINNILTKIYLYVGMSVTVENYLANDNLHSRYPVLFPEISTDLTSQPDALKSLCESFVEMANQYTVTDNNKKSVARLTHKIKKSVDY